MASRSLPSVTVVIVSLNSRDTISECISSVLTQNYPNLEVIVVDGGSTDGTIDVVKATPARLIVELGAGIARSRNIGVKHAKGEIIAMIDSDATAAPGWLRSLVDCLREPEVAAVGGPNLPHPSARGLGKLIGMLPMETRLYPDIRYATHEDICTRNIAYRKKAILEAGGFDEELAAAEDIDLNWRISQRGYKLKYTPKAIVYHRPRHTLKALMAQIHRNGRGLAQLIKKGRSKAIKIHKYIIGATLLLTIPLLIPLAKNLWAKALLIPLTTLYLLHPLTQAIEAHKRGAPKKYLPAIIALTTLIQTVLLATILTELPTREESITSPKSSKHTNP